MSQARDLWWPPFGRLQMELERVQSDPSAHALEHLHSLLKESAPWLAKGLKGFKGPNASSKRAVETENSLKIGDKKAVPVEAPLRAPTFQVSQALVSARITF